MPLPAAPAQAAILVARQLTSLRVLAATGIIKPYSPLALLRAARALVVWGMGPAGGFTVQAILARDTTALIDELGELTFGDLHERSNALADSLAARGVGTDRGIAVMCRNHRGFVDATLAAAKLGADIVYLNTAFAGPQLVDVLAQERPVVVVHDEEFSGLLAGADVDRILAWTDGPVETPTLERLIAAGSPEERKPPTRNSRMVILTSGTTGTPKGAPRSKAGIDAAVALLSRLPLKGRWRTHVAAPLFHTWGWAHLALSMLLGSTVVLRRRFDPEDCLDTVTRNDCDSLVVIPVMLQRILRLPHETLDAHDLSGVKIVAASGSALPGDLSAEWMDQFGDTLFNIYGSTEVAYATIANPVDLREAPGTAGKAPHHTVVKVYDADDREVPRGETGRIFVGNSLLFEGYTGGGSKAMIDGLMATGDIGHFDEDGRLFVEGRDDEMIVSGGENVFPQEVEDCLARHPGVVEAAVIGVDDPDFGKRLRAFVVLSNSGAADEEDLKEHVKQNLARFKVPREVVFVDELPRNATGKVLKRALADSG